MDFILCPECQVQVPPVVKLRAPKNARLQHLDRELNYSLSKPTPVKSLNLPRARQRV